MLGVNFVIVGRMFSKLMVRSILLKKTLWSVLGVSTKYSEVGGSEIKFER